MNRRLELARQLEERASASVSLAEAQALRAQADRLRGHRGIAFGSPLQPLFRN